MSTQYGETEGQIRSADAEYVLGLALYPVDMSSFLALSESALDPAGMPYQMSPAEYNPTTIAQYALAHWNKYITTNDEHHLRNFLTQASWFVEHETRIGEDFSGWPISFPHANVHVSGSWLSALTQGSGISVLIRAYQITREETFLEVAHRAARTFERDILDGGVSAPIGGDGVFFEEIAVYPAAHMLSGCIFALLGLYDYIALTHDARIQQLIQRGLTTMHGMLDEFDVGFWTREDLLHRCLASPSQLTLQAMLLEALAKYSSCTHCSALASRWKSYQGKFGSRLAYWVSSRWSSYGRALLGRVRAAFFPQVQRSSFVRACVSVPDFPVTGGVLTVLQGIALVTKDIWQLEYLTQHVGSQSEKFVIHRYGAAKMGPWQFPNVWFFGLAGYWKLISLLCHGAGYHVIFPQDGVYTAAFTALAGKLAGIRVVCIDHGHLTLLKSRSYRAERIKTLAARKRPLRLLSRLRYMWYWPSLYLLAMIAAPLVDHYLIPGVEGDGVEDICKRLGIPPSRITRFASMIEIDRHIVPDAASRANIREKKDIDSDAIVIAIICRLAPEKGLGIALESISRGLSALPPDLLTRVRVIIAGDGPLRKEIEADIQLRGLSQTCSLWGETSPADVISLLGISDIFLYTSTRGACFAMTILEAMASGCAVIASTQPMSNAHLLAEGRGIAVRAGDVIQTSEALARLVNDLELCRQMGRLARDYITLHHSPAMFMRTLLRATYWSNLDRILARG